MKPRLIVEQKITAFTNQYSIYSADEQGQKGTLVAFAQQKRVALKEKVTFYADEQKTQVLFSFRAEKVMDVHGRYIVEDAAGQTIGMFKKEFKKSLFNSTWRVRSAQGTQVALVQESNQTVAILRRFANFIPFVGEIVNLAMSFIPYHFSFQDEQGREQGMYKKTTRLRDHYVLAMTDAMYQSTDWRTYAAFGVALDALQSR